jgi:iron(III) transport system permease protein
MNAAQAARTAARLGSSAALFAVLGVLILLPLAMVLYTAFIDVLPFSGNRQAQWTLENFHAIWTPELGAATINTLIVSIGGTAVAMTFGCGLAWLGARTNVPWKALVHLSGVMPLFLSLLVAAVTWSLLGAGYSGYLNIIFRSVGIPFGIEMRSLAGIALVEGIYYAPYAYIFLHGALALVHPDLEESAAIHGGRFTQILSMISFPLVKPALIGSALLVFVLIAEDFPVPSDSRRPGRHRDAVDAHLQFDDARAEPAQPRQCSFRPTDRRGLGAGLHPATRACYRRLSYSDWQGNAATRN